jgi:hypothetical protein
MSIWCQEFDIFWETFSVYVIHKRRRRCQAQHLSLSFVNSQQESGKAFKAAARGYRAFKSLRAEAERLLSAGISVGNRRRSDSPIAPDSPARMNLMRCRRAGCINDTCFLIWAHAPHIHSFVVADGECMRSVMRKCLRCALMICIFWRVDFAVNWREVCL